MKAIWKRVWRRHRIGQRIGDRSAGIFAVRSMVDELWNIPNDRRAALVEELARALKAARV